ncbi:MAG: hypothetical protein WC211_10870 [Dehalococcoidia bacterium]
MADCDIYLEWQTEAYERSQAALDAQQAAVESAALAMAAFAAAEVWAASCFALVFVPGTGPLAVAICEVPVIAALDASAAAVLYYEEKAQEALEAYEAAERSAEILQGLYDTCVSQQASNTPVSPAHAAQMMAEAEAAHAESVAVVIPEIDSDLLEEAEDAVEEAEGAVSEAEDAAEEAVPAGYYV